MDATDPNATAPDVLASTDSTGSPWYTGLLQTAVDTGVNFGDQAINNAIGSQTPITPTPVVAPHVAAAAASPVVKAAGGLSVSVLVAVVAVVLVIVLARK